MNLKQIEAVKFEEIMANLPPIETLNDEELTRLCSIKEEIKDRQKKYAILYYEPQPHQLEFHKSPKKLRYISGGNQSGKSRCSTIEGIQLSLGIHPYHQMKVPNKGRVIAPDLEKYIGEVIGDIYEQYVPKNEISVIRHYPRGQMAKVIYKNGSTTDFLSYEQDTKSMEGWTGDWVQYDEPPPRDKYIANLRGLIRNKGICWIAATPLNEPWLYDEIYTQAGKGEFQPDVFIFDIRDNKYLSEEEILDFESKLLPDEKEARLHGKSKHLCGLIYKEFNPSIHCMPSFEIPKSWTRYVAQDYHPRVHCAITWIAVDPKNRVYVYDELWIDKTVKEIAETIKIKENKNNIRARFIDPLSATPDRISGSSPQREFARYGLHFRSATKDWITGKNTVNEYFKLDKEGKPGIFFFSDRVPRNIEGMTHYQWDEYAGNRDGEKETPMKKYSHFPDTVRYILIMRPSYQPPEAQTMLDKFLESQQTGKIKTGYKNFGNGVIKK